MTLVDDVNSDGFGDVLVGIPDDELAGGARVYSGRTGALLRTHGGDSLEDRFGAAVAAVGDLDADGVGEYAIASPLADNTIFFPPASGPDAGRIRIVNGASGEAHLTLSGGTLYDLGQMGFSVAGAGDVNLDGIPDVIAGGPFSDVNGNESGRANVYSGAGGATLFAINGDGADDELGWSVAGMGDVNGDGRSDVLVGAPNDEVGTPHAGAIRICSGANGAVIHHVGLIQTGARWGEAVCGLGDLNADGIPDYAAGAPGWDGGAPDTGAVFVGSGFTGVSMIPQIDGAASFFGTGERLGASLARIGDMNNDGRSELAIGAPSHDAFLDLNVGRAKVYSARDGLLLYSFGGDAAGDALGHSVGGGFDLNGDGRGDLVAGAPSADLSGAESGMARVWSLSPAGLQPFGPGTPGCEGTQLAFANSVPNVGNTAFQLNVAAGQKNAISPPTSPRAPTKTIPPHRARRPTAMPATPSTKAKAPKRSTSARRVIPGQTNAIRPNRIATAPRSASAPQPLHTDPSSGFAIAMDHLRAASP